MTQPFRFRLPGILLAAALVVGCGDRDDAAERVGPTPPAVDPATLEAPVTASPDTAAEPSIAVGVWAPILPPVAAGDVRRALRDAREAFDEGRLLAAEGTEAALP